MGVSHQWFQGFKVSKVFFNLLNWYDTLFCDLGVQQGISLVLVISVNPVILLIAGSSQSPLPSQSPGIPVIPIILCITVIESFIHLIPPTLVILTSHKVTIAMPVILVIPATPVISVILVIILININHKPQSYPQLPKSSQSSKPSRHPCNPSHFSHHSHPSYSSHPSHPT